MSQIKECPFCKREMKVYEDGDFAHPQNDDCILSEGLYLKEEADLWNTRNE